MVQAKKTKTKKGSSARTPKLIKPTNRDILCGKDKACVTHEGSCRFRDLIGTYSARYEKAETKQEKMSITKEIVVVVSKKSRFLKYNDASGGWEEISHLAARDKVSHALRFASKKENRRKEKMEKQGDFEQSTASVVAASCLSNQKPTRGYEGFVQRQQHLLSSIKTYERGQDNPASPDPTSSHKGHVRKVSADELPELCSIFSSEDDYIGTFDFPLFDEKNDQFEEEPILLYPGSSISREEDLDFIMREPLMEWDLETDTIIVVR